MNWGSSMSEVKKQFGCVETIQKLLVYRDVLFDVIRYMDVNRTSSIPEFEFQKYVLRMPASSIKEVAKELLAVFDIENLKQSRILTDQKMLDGHSVIMFNPHVIGLFRLCETSLIRSLNVQALNNAMSPIWAMMKSHTEGKLSLVKGSEDYKEWTDELINHLSDLIGRIKSNIDKLQNMSMLIEQQACSSTEITRQFELKKEIFKRASSIYRREIKPLVTFLGRHANYDQGSGITKCLELFASIFKSIDDSVLADMMLTYHVQFCDMHTPIKQIADEISVFLKKSREALIEQSGIEKAFADIEAAYQQTLSTDMRNKYIDLRKLKQLSMPTRLPAINKPMSLRIDKEPSYLNNVFIEIEQRAHRSNEFLDGEILLSELIDRKNVLEIQHSLAVHKWSKNHHWPLEEDCLQIALNEVSKHVPDFKMPDLLEVLSSLQSDPRFKILVTNEFKTVSDNEYKINYRVRQLSLVN